VAVTLAVVPEPREYGTARLGIVDGLATMSRNRPFLRLLAAFVLNGFANGLPATLFLFFVGERLQAPDQAGLILITYFFSGVLGVPLWTAVSRRLGKHRTWCIAMLGACAVFAVVPLLGPGDVPAFLVVAVLTGIALGADLVLPSSIQADVIDVDTATSGEQRTGTYVAAWGLGTKLALALAVGVAFPVLAWAGFDATGGPQTEFALTTLALLYAGVPVIMKLVAIVLMWNFPVDAATQARLRARIEASTA
jgi:Na+/melibiose symporter-like transporter